MSYIWISLGSHPFFVWFLHQSLWMSSFPLSSVTVLDFKIFSSHIAVLRKVVTKWHSFIPLRSQIQFKPLASATSRKTSPALTDLTMSKVFGLKHYGFPGPRHLLVQLFKSFHEQAISSNILLTLIKLVLCLSHVLCKVLNGMQEQNNLPISHNQDLSRPTHHSFS